MRFIYFIVILLGLAVFLGCTDGKFNLLLVLWSEDDSEPSSASFEAPSSSSIAIPLSSGALPSSSSGEIIPPYSSSEEEPAPPSSSSRGPRSSSSINQVDFPPPLEEGAPGIERANPGGVTRYWDGCKPSCSYVANSRVNGIFTNPHGVARVCDRNGNEMPLHYRQPPEAQTHAVFLGTPNSCNRHDIRDWLNSSTYAEWKKLHPNFPTGEQSAGYVCAADQIPYAVNDTLAYAFAANDHGNCGKCFQLQFRSDWIYAAARPSHRAIAGKTLIVMVTNFGVKEDAFDIMIPGGGVGMYDAFTEQLGLPQNDNPDDYTVLGAQYGGLLTECIFGTRNLPYSAIGGGLVGATGGHERATLEESKECLRTKCNRAFADHPVLLKGCLWHVDWFEAVDNPEASYKEVPCPKYLVDRYGSSFSLPTRPEDLYPNAHCEVEGELCAP